MKSKFQTLFNHAPEITTFAPGRVNLLGEHTDYNGGLVLPVTIDLGIQITLSSRTDSSINIASSSFEGTVSRSLKSTAAQHWSDYALGAVKKANALNLTSGGADIMIESNLPYGAGLSSSAALTVGLLKIFRNKSASNITDTQIAQYAKQIENEFIGVPCGIMDQMVIANALSDHAMKLDTDNLEFEHIPLNPNFRMVVIHSGYYRQLSDGRYKVRKKECDEIKDIVNRNDICRMPLETLETLRQTHSKLFLRGRHCITEHKRTQQGAKALNENNFVEFGELMNESHQSLKNDFEITLPEIDNLVADAVKLGALGARQTGGGFGGCIVACVEADRVESWTETLISNHPKAYYVC